MLKQSIFKIEKNERIADNTFRIRLRGDSSAFSRPGQFANIKLDGFFLRRPISVCDYDDNGVTLIYKTVGAGTEKLCALLSGAELDVITGLGNGFDTSKSGEHPLLIAGGSGVPPMVGLAKKLISEGKSVTAALGFNTKSEVYCENELAVLGAKVIVATVDGSYGVSGFVTDAMQWLEYSFFYACGSMPMYNAVRSAVKTKGQYSFEERMGCGFGACMGCSCRTKNGNKRICKDGPVLDSEEIIW